MTTLESSPVPASPDGDAFDYGTLAQQLADLSREGQLPEGVADPEDIRSAPFLASEIDFDSNDWVQRLVGIQAWLGLDAPLPHRAGAGGVLRQLFAEITYHRPEQCMSELEGGRVLPTDQGLQQLEAWLSRAIEYRLELEEQIDEGRTFKDASAQWRQQWEESGSQALQPFGRINAKVEAWKIKSFRGQAEERLLDLNPSYQRDFVWSLGESQKLITSILRGIPLPSVILTQSEGDDVWQIVDGKQRLTTILRFMGRHPDGRGFAEGKVGDLDLFDKDFRAFVRKNSLSSRDLAAHFLPFRLERYEEPDPLARLSGKYYSEIRDMNVPIGGEDIKVWKLFESEASNYLIPVILYSKTSLQDIHRVFGLYNRQGRKLNAEELRNAGYHHLSLTKLLLVVSGDRADTEAIQSLVPFLPPEIVGRVAEGGNLLADLNFGTARFKRTKVLSWATAVLLHPPNESTPGQLATPSTSSHINALLDEIGEIGDRHPLFQIQPLRALAKTWQDTLVAHSDAADAFAPKLRNRRGTGAKWEELPAVATLVTTFLVVTAGQQEKLLERIPQLRELTQKLEGPRKTQNKHQWEYIARVVMTLLPALDIDEATLRAILMERYGYDCLRTFAQLAKRVAE